jgi:hypothetical protein
MSKRILVMEDEKDNRQIIQRIKIRWPYNEPTVVSLASSRW